MDNDFMGTSDRVALMFQNEKISGARKMLQRAVLMLFTTLDETDAPYGTNFYTNLKRASASDTDRLTSMLNTALSTVRSDMTSYASAADPVMTSLTGQVETVSAGVATATIALELEDGSEETTTVELGEATDE